VNLSFVIPLPSLFVLHTSEEDISDAHYHYISIYSINLGCSQRGYASERYCHSSNSCKHSTRLSRIRTVCSLPTFLSIPVTELHLAPSSHRFACLRVSPQTVRRIIGWQLPVSMSTRGTEPKKKQQVSKEGGCPDRCEYWGWCGVRPITN
jgi:hypothetical protein